jgi:hypothetical protein
MSDDEAERFTADDGRIVVEYQLGGYLCSGRQLHPLERELVIVVKDFPYATHKEALDGGFRYDAPGIATLAYLGYPDGASPTPEQLRAMQKRGRTSAALLAEVKPEGTPLCEAAPLTDAEVVRLGLALCDTAIGWIERRGSATEGLRPETIYLAGAHGARAFTGATPRIVALVGNGDIDGTFPATYYGSPLAASALEHDGNDIAYVVALVLWFAATGEHAYRHSHYVDQPRAPFRGPPALGELLAAALDQHDRMNVQQLRDGLDRLAPST